MFLYLFLSILRILRFLSLSLRRTILMLLPYSRSNSEFVVTQSLSSVSTFLPYILVTVVLFYLIKLPYLLYQQIALSQTSFRILNTNLLSTVILLSISQQKPLIKAISTLVFLIYKLYRLLLRSYVSEQVVPVLYLLLSYAVEISLCLSTTVYYL